MDGRTHGGAAGKLTASARALYRKKPSDAELAALGLRASDFPDGAIEVWPENWRSVLFFNALGMGCWAVGPNGRPYGLRYEAFRDVRLAHAITAAEWPQVFDDVQHMERAALQEMQGAQ